MFIYLGGGDLGWYGVSFLDGGWNLLALLLQVLAGEIGAVYESGNITLLVDVRVRCMHDDACLRLTKKSLGRFETKRVVSLAMSF